MAKKTSKGAVTAMAKVIDVAHADSAPRVLRTRRPAPTPTSEDPRDDLRKLVRQHRALVKSAVKLHNMSHDKKNRTTGAIIPCVLPLEIQLAYHKYEEATKQAAEALEKDIYFFLKQVPIYQTFLKHVYGVGTITAAYLVSEIDISDRAGKDGVVRGLKPSSIRRYCGLHVLDDGRLAHPVAGQKLDYNAELRVRLYQISDAWRTNARGRTCKYLGIWADKKRGKLAGAVDGKIGTRSAAGYADSAGRYTALGVFLNDLYVVWRALEGLDIWPGWYAAKLGYGHGGVKIDNQRPTRLTVDEALALVGDVAAQPIAQAEAA